MHIGYARISTPHQKFDLQQDALTAASCTRVFTDISSGAKAVRPGLTEALAYLRDDVGDVLVVWKLDRLGRSLRDLIEAVRRLEERGIGFQSLQEDLNTTTPSGALLFHMLGALAEFERDLIKERVSAGLAAARGRLGGRNPALNPTQVAAARALHRDPSQTIAEIATALHGSQSRVSRALRHGRCPVDLAAAD
jgi:DNA invertase Pin-like site-specific DNA recombinase